MSNTYFVPFKTKRLPESEEPKEMIGYYQWVPMILLSQALLFYLPCMVWRFLNNKAGIDVNNIVEAAIALQHTAYAESRDKTIRYMTKHLDRYLTSTREYRRGCLVNCKHFVSRNCCLVCGRRYGNYLVFLYLGVKFLYLVNLIGQLFMLNAFLGTDYHVYGIQVVYRMIQQENWTVSERFPRVTLCDFQIRQLGNIHRHTVQCVLPINLFNEKIFIFIWFWFIFCSLSTLVSLITWLTRCIFRLDQIRYVKRHLRAMDRFDKNDDKKVGAKFVTEYLRQDGILILRLVGINANDLVVSELMAELWNHYRTSQPLLTRNRRDSVAV